VITSEIEVVPEGDGQLAPANALQVQLPVARNGAVEAQLSLTVTGLTVSDGPLF